MTSTASLQPPPDETSLGDVVPLGEFLWSLRQRGIPVGLRDYRSVERLLLRWPSTDSALLRDAVASIIARNEQELAVVRAAFEEWFDESEAPPPPPPPKTRRVPRAKALIAALLFLLVAISGAGGLKVWRWMHQPPVQAIKQRPADTPAATANRPPPPPLPPERRGNSMRIAAVAATIAALLVLFAAVARRTRRRRAEWKRDYLHESLAGSSGPSRYEPAVKRSAPLIDRTWAEDVAQIIGSAVDTEEQSDHLDVEQSLRLTLRAGMRPELVFDAPPRNATVLILQDTSAEMRPWREKVDTFVAELVRQRVAIERWFFDSDPSVVWRESFGRRATLERLSGQRGALSLLVISSGDAAGRLAGSSVATVLRRWGYRAWLSPVGNPAYWPAALWRLPLRVWPMTRNGLRGMAWDLAHTSLAAPCDLADAPRLVSADDVERMKRLIALVPSPTLALADELRRRYANDIPEEVVLFLAAEGTFRGERYCLPKEEIVRLLAAERIDAPSHEQRVRQYLLDVLRESEPAAGSVAHLRWQLDLAMQTMHVHTISGQSHAEPLAILGTLAEGPLREEVEAAAKTLHVAQSVQCDVRRTLRDAAARLPSIVPDSIRTLPPRLALPGSMALPIAALIAGCAFLAARPAGKGTGDLMPHQYDAYRLTDAGNGSYALTRLSRAPGTATIFAGEQALTRVHVPGSVHPGVDGVYLQARSELAGGRLALSNLVWVPKRVVQPPPPPPYMTPPRSEPTVPLANAAADNNKKQADEHPVIQQTVGQVRPGTLHIDVDPISLSGLPADQAKLPMTPPTVTVRDAANRQIVWNGADVTLPPGRYAVTSSLDGFTLLSATAQVVAGKTASLAMKPDRGVVSLSATSQAPMTMRLKPTRRIAQLVDRGAGRYDLFATAGTYDIDVAIAGYVPSTVPVTVVSGASHKEIIAPDVMFDESSAQLDQKTLVSKKSTTYKVEERTAFEVVRTDGAVISYRKIAGRDIWRERDGQTTNSIAVELPYGGATHISATDGMILKGAQDLFIPNRITPAGSGIDDTSAFVLVNGKWQPYGRVRDIAASAK